MQAAYTKIKPAKSAGIAHQNTGVNGIALPARSILQKRDQHESFNAETSGSRVTERPLQLKAFQLETGTLQKKEDKTGLPANLKSGIESVSGFSMDDVRVHYNSSKPAQLQAFAYAQGSDIHVAPGQEKHLPHEAWHVVQQNQGRVRPALQMKAGGAFNNDQALEREADMMGNRASETGGKAVAIKSAQLIHKDISAGNLPIQRKVIARIRTGQISQELGRIITDIIISGRAPTDTPTSAQGDHTVAETLINESVKREILGQNRQVALNNLLVLARMTLESVPDRLELFIGKYQQYFYSIATLEGEDQNALIESMIEDYITHANKRPGTAFLRKDELTTGGGNGHEEKKAITSVRNVAEKREIQPTDLNAVARDVSLLVDLKFSMAGVDRASELTVRALKHLVFSVLVNLNQEQGLYVINTTMNILLKREGVSSEFTIAYKQAVLDGFK